MKKNINILLALLLSSIFIACNSGNNTELNEESNSTTVEVPNDSNTTQTQTENQKIPTCYITKGTPVTDSLIVVHTKCKNGNIPIDEATVTLDNKVKSVDYKGVYFSDYIGFDNLQPSTTYKAVLEVVVGGKTIKKSVKIKTKEEKVVHTAPKWNKKIYETYRVFDDTNNKINLNLKQEVSSNKGDKITFKVLSNSYEILDDTTCIQDLPFVESKSIQVANDKLIIKYFPPCVGVITSVVQAKSIGGVSNTTVKVNFKSIPWMPIGNTPPVWTKDFYELTLRSLDIPSDNTILDLNKLCSSNTSIYYEVKSVKFIEGEHLPDEPDPVLAKSYSLSSELSIDSGKLKLSSMPLGGGVGTIVIQAKSSGGYSDTRINISLESLYLP